MVITGDTPLRYKGIADCLCLTPINWFIQSYIGLYVISPILNAFIENASKKQLEVVVIAFYVFQTIYGYLGGAQFIAHGYSTFSFIGLYLLAQYIKRFVTIDYKWGGVVFILTALINVAAQILLYKLPLSIFTYDNPMVILGAASLFIYFNGLKIRYSRVINYIAKSCFAVFLFHFNPNIGDQFYRPLCRFIYNSFSGIECLGIFLITLLGIFAIAIILDLPRRKIWDCISKKIPNLNWDSLL